ncbi:MAG: hypothetical protein IH944_01390 [Armatimonadetes bacterium]|nr:hypothetical protein [Armatimonadota bacterium]
MKKPGARLAVLGVFLMIAVGCSSSASDAKSADDVTIGMTEQEVIDVLGEPRWRVGPISGDTMLDPYSASQDRLVYFNVEDAPMLIIWMMDGKVTRVEVETDVEVPDSYK